MADGKKPTIDESYGMLGALGIRVEQLKEGLINTERELTETTKMTIERIRNGEGSGNRFRDFVFVKLNGQHNDPLEKWLAHLDAQLDAHPGHLVLVVKNEPYDPGPSGGVIFDHHSEYQPEGLELAKRRILRLAVNGGGLILDPKATDYASLLCIKFVERVSLMTWGHREVESFPAEVRDVSCQICFVERGTGFLAQALPVSKELLGPRTAEVLPLPLEVPKIVVGNQTVTQWMLNNRLHHDTGGIPSAFQEMCRMLDHRLDNN